MLVVSLFKQVIFTKHQIIAGCINYRIPSTLIGPEFATFADPKSAAWQYCFSRASHILPFKYRADD
jgi:hypothetical protein